MSARLSIPSAGSPSTRFQAPGGAGGNSRLGTLPEGLGCEAGTARAPAQPESWAASSVSVSVYHCRPAPDPIKGWVHSFLPPLLQILKTPGHPIEFRPTGQFDGWAPSDKSTDPEQRIKVSNLVLFRHKSSFASLYVHELAHALIDEAERQFDPEAPPHFHQHDPAFFCLNLYFLRLLDQAKFMSECMTGPESWQNTMSLYDLQDPPPFYFDSPQREWKPLSLAWAIETVDDLMNLDLSAKAAAAEIVKRYWAWAESHFKKTQRATEEKQQLHSEKVKEQQNLARLRSALQLYRWVSGILFLGFSTLIYFAV